MWDHREQAAALALLMQALQGVGDETGEHREIGEISFHLRRATTAEEEERLQPALKAKKVEFLKKGLSWLW